MGTPDRRGLGRHDEQQISAPRTEGLARSYSSSMQGCAESKRSKLPVAGSDQAASSKECCGDSFEGAGEGMCEVLGARDLYDSSAADPGEPLPLKYGHTPTLKGLAECPRCAAGVC